MLQNLKYYCIISVLQQGRLAQLVEHSLDVRRVSGSSPLTSTTSSQATYRLRRFFYRLALIPLLLLFRKNHARLACSVVNALTTAHCRYQLLRFADRFKPRGKKICKKQKADGLKSSSAFWCERRNLNAKLRLPFTATIICSFCSATLRKRWTNGFKSRGKCVGKNKKQTN